MCCIRKVMIVLGCRLNNMPFKLGNILRMTTDRKYKNIPSPVRPNWFFVSIGLVKFVRPTRVITNGHSGFLFKLFESWYNKDADKAEDISELIKVINASEGNSKVNAVCDDNIEPFSAE